MARTSLSKSHAKLNLSNAKTVWLQKTVNVGNRMAEILRDAPVAEQAELAATWNRLIDELVKMMLF